MPTDFRGILSMPAFEITSIVILSLAAWLWLDSIKARDIGIHAVKSACAARGLQLLDDTVAIASLGMTRDEEGRLMLNRRYAFEYSISGEDRRRGSVTLLGHQVVGLDIGPRLA
jgi:hypothetical protein